MDTVETYQHRGCSIRVEADDSPESPRKWDNFGTMVCWHKRYNLGDEQPSEDPSEWRRNLAGMLVKAHDPELIPDEHVTRILQKHAIIKPLFLYDHSGITMSTGPFSCPWDSGRVGYIYCTMEDARKEWANLPDDQLRAKADALMTSEVKVYDDFITGQVYGYVAESWDGTEIDSCWGYYGYDETKENSYMVQCGRDAIDNYIDEEAPIELAQEGEH